MRTELFAIALLMSSLLGAPAGAAPSAAELEASGNLFAISCSSSFCHGEGGVGARGPSLRDRNFPLGYVRDTIMNGRSGTPMPSFKDALTSTEIAMIAGYVMSLSPNNHVGSSEEVPAPMNAAAPLSDQAARGQDLFFDEARPASCAACHSYGAKGGLIGPDLSIIASQSPESIYRSIVKPAATSEAYPAITVTTKSGQSMTGITQSQNAQQVSLFDISSAPPVLRSFYFADGVKSEPSTSIAPYHHDLSAYSNAEIVDLVAFLKSADGAKPVTAQELGLK